MVLCTVTVSTVHALYALILHLILTTDLQVTHCHTNFANKECKVLEKAECQRISAFKLWCWRRLLRVPWTARSNQSALREIDSEYSLEGLMLMLKLQCFGHLMWTANSLEKSLMLRKIKGKRRRGHYRKRWLDGITNATHMNSRGWWGAGTPGVLQSTGSQRVGHD